MKKKPISASDLGKLGAQARWKGKTAEEKKSHSDKMNANNPKWKKHLENLTKLSEVLKEETK